MEQSSDILTLMGIAVALSAYLSAIRLAGIMKISELPKQVSIPIKKEIIGDFVKTQVMVVLNERKIELQNAKKNRLQPKEIKNLTTQIKKLLESNNKELTAEQMKSITDKIDKSVKKPVKEIELDISEKLVIPGQEELVMGRIEELSIKKYIKYLKGETKSKIDKFEITSQDEQNKEKLKKLVQNLNFQSTIDVIIEKTEELYREADNFIKTIKLQLGKNTKDTLTIKSLDRRSQIKSKLALLIIADIPMIFSAALLALYTFWKQLFCKSAPECILTWGIRAFFIGGGVMIFLHLLAWIKSIISYIKVVCKKNKIY